MRLGTVENMRHDDDSPNDNRTQQLNPEALAAEVTGFLEQVPVGELVGAKLSRVLDGFLQGEVFPQADRAAGQGIDPTPLLAVTAEVLRRYADALHPPEVAG
jgi:hypothetical protein